MRLTNDDVARFTNWQIVVLALWSLGGESKPQDTEDIAVRCWDIAPRRFAWSKYPDFPNLDTARVALSDAKKRKHGTLVAGDQHTGWLLTDDGVRWAQHNADTAASKGLGTSALTRDDDQSLRSVESHPAYMSWARGTHELELFEIAEALQLPADAPHRTVKRRAQELLNAAIAAERERMVEFLKWVRARTEKAT